MKRIIIFACLVATAMCVSSCQSGPKKEKFTTPDLTFFELNGHVSTVKFEDVSKNLVFTRDGKLNSMGGLSFVDENHSFGFSRGKGELADYIIAYNDFTSMEEYTWENGVVVSSEERGEGSIIRTKYTYFANGDLKSSELEMSGIYTPEFTSMKKYKVTKCDEHGNWIERKVKSKESMHGKQTLTNIETREITYYED